FYTTPLPLCMLFSFFFSSSAARRALHSFPTRRSSDLRYHAGADGTDAFNAPIAAKIGEITLPHWRNGLAFADEHQLLPRSYLWGLADTVRTGVEGRSLGMHFVWGQTYYGTPPWFAWPAIIVAKIPLALLVLALAGVPLAFRRSLPAAARW